MMRRLGHHVDKICLFNQSSPRNKYSRMHPAACMTQPRFTPGDPHSPLNAHFFALVQLAAACLKASLCERSLLVFLILTSSSFMKRLYADGPFLALSAPAFAVFLLDFFGTAGTAHRCGR